MEQSKRYTMLSILIGLYVVTSIGLYVVTSIHHTYKGGINDYTHILVFNNFNLNIVNFNYQHWISNFFLCHMKHHKHSFLHI